MSLNIKNERVHDLVRRAASRTGQSQTAVVEKAVEWYLAELDRSAGADDLDAVVERMQKAWRESSEPPFSAEDLYDSETGLPA